MANVAVRLLPSMQLMHVIVGVRGEAVVVVVVFVLVEMMMGKRTKSRRLIVRLRLELVQEVVMLVLLSTTVKPLVWHGTHIAAADAFRQVPHQTIGGRGCRRRHSRQRQLAAGALCSRI